MKFKKKLGRVLSALFIFSIISKGVISYADYTTYEVQQITYSNLKKYSNSVAMYDTQLSLLTSINNITRLYLWTDYMCNVEQSQAMFSDSEKQYYSKELRNKLIKFNDKFSSAEGFTPLTLPVFEEDQIASGMQAYIDVISKYIISIYDLHSEAFNALPSTEERNTYYSDNSAILDLCYTIILRFKQDYSTVGTLLPFQLNNISYGLNLAELNGVVTNSNYKELIEYTLQSIETQLNTDTDISINDSDNYITKFAKLNDSEEIEEVVNNAYLACFSASSLYMPMQDKIGEANVIEAINYLANDEDVSKAYTDIATRKKPLYLRGYDTVNKEPYGSGNAVTLGDFIESVLNNKSGALVTVEGSFQTNEDGDSYEMSTGNSVTRYDTGSQAGTTVDGSTSSNDSTGESTEGESNGTSSDSSSNSSNNADTLMDDTGTVTVLDETISAESNFSEPVFLYSSDALPRLVTNSILVTNYFTNNSLLDLDSEMAKSSALFVNPFGDIILADNTVVIPAAANATYYVEDDGVVYNPFTEMFMAGYPQIQSGLSLEAAKKAENSGKYVIAVVKEIADDTTFLEKCSIKLDSWFNNVMAYKLNNSGLTYRSKSNLMPIDTGLYAFSSENKTNMFVPEEKDIGWWKSLWNKGDLGNYLFYRMDYNTISVDGINAPLYPYGNSTGEEAVVRAKYLAESFYVSMTTSVDGFVAVNAGRIDDRLLYKTLVTALDGRLNVTGFQRSFTERILDSESKGLFYKLVKMVIDACDNLVEVFADTPGLLGVRPANQDFVMGKFLYYAKLLIVYIFIALVLFFIGTFLRRRLNFWYSFFGTVFACLIVFLSIYFFPKHLATAANFLSSNKSNALAFSALALRQEGNTGDAYTTSLYQGVGTFNYSTSSINIYKLTDDEIKYLCEINDADYATIISGGALVLDETTGLYLEGDCLKMELDKFFDISSITGSLETRGSVATYTLEVTKNIGSVVDYYMPYNLIVESFVGELNKLSEVYSIPRNQNNYGNGFWKDSFLVDSFIYSPVFLTPLDYRSTDSEMSEVLYNSLVSKFGETNVDFLNLNNVFTQANSVENTTQNSFTDSLWYRTMEQNGYFDGSSLAQEKYVHLIEYVNFQVKQFLIENRDYFIYMADENIIEITALYATMVLNNEVSEFSNVLYPQTLNFEAFSVIDIIRSVVVTDMNKYATLDRSLLDYGYSMFGWLGLIGITGSVIFSSLTSILINISVYILYLMLLAFCLIRLVFGKKVNEAFKGFLKIFFAISFVYMISIWGTALLDKFTDGRITVLFLLLLYGLSFGLVLNILVFIFTGLGSMDFSNTKVTAFLKGMKDKINPFRRDNEKIHAAKISADSLNTPEGVDYNFMLGDIDGDTLSSVAMDNFIRERYSNHTSSNVNTRRTEKFRRKRQRSTRAENYTFVEDDDL